MVAIALFLSPFNNNLQSIYRLGRQLHHRTWRSHASHWSYRVSSTSDSDLHITAGKEELKFKGRDLYLAILTKRDSKLQETDVDKWKTKFETLAMRSDDSLKSFMTRLDRILMELANRQKPISVADKLTKIRQRLCSDENITYDRLARDFANTAKYKTMEKVRSRIE